MCMFQEITKINDCKQPDFSSRFAQFYRDAWDNAIYIM